MFNLPMMILLVFSNLIFGALRTTQLQFKVNVIPLLCYIRISLTNSLAPLISLACCGLVVDV